MPRVYSVLLFCCLATVGCGDSKPPKPTPKDDPSTQKTIEQPPEIEMPSFDTPKPSEPAKPAENPPVKPATSDAKPAGSVSLPPAPVDAAAWAKLTPPELVARLGDSATREQAAASIAARSGELMPTLQSLLGASDGDVRANAAFALSLLGKGAEQAADKLKEISTSDQHETARAAARFALDAIAGK